MSSSNTHATINRRDLDFQLFEVLAAASLSTRAEYRDHDRSTLSAALELAERVAADHFQPHYRESDLVEPRIENGKVRLTPGTKAALRAFAEAGFMSADRSYEEGGQQLPFVVLQACLACFQAANISTSSYNFLAMAGAAVIREFGSAEQVATYMRPMLDGRYLGTMCLSEPDAGSGLADIKTRAMLQPDGSYRLKGKKMWISAGEHELSDNIIHLVLARIDGAPAGTRGISLFIVPRYRVNADGSRGGDNDVRLMGLNHKMGYRGTVNTLLSFGDDGACEGHLVGEAHRGLGYMFHMMNEARISVGTGAAMLGVAGYLCSLDYARNRIQGRVPGAKGPLDLAVPIIEHADVRRMLLVQKCYVEGALALCLYAASVIDDVRTAETPQERQRAADLLEILTPLVKSWPSEFCLEANKLAIQVLGGYGYTRDFPVEQYYRDNRLNLIHEGTHGIQAMDLVGRKIRAADGSLLKALLGCMRDDAAAASQIVELRALSRQLQSATDSVEQATRSMLAAPTEQVRTANATMYLDMLGHLSVGWMWLRQARVAAQALAGAAEPEGRSFYSGKLTACRHFFDYEMPRLDYWLPILASANDTYAALDTQCL